MKNVLRYYNGKDFYKEYNDEDIKRLIEKTLKGNIVSRNSLVLSNIGLVINIAKCYTFFGIPFEDLIQEGILGLMKAIDRFDINKGIKLSTYATWWIRQYISYKIKRKCDPIKPPELLIEVVSYLHKNYSLPLSEENIEEIIEKKKISKGYLQEALELLETPILKLEVNNITDIEMEEKEENPTKSISSDVYFKKNMLEEINNLGEKDRDIIKFSFGIECYRPYTPKEIGKYLGMRTDQVTQRKGILLKRLKNNKSIKDIKKELDE